MTTTAFALQGLGGSNAHGAGFLAAAQQVARKSDGPGGSGPLDELRAISCTSGAIYWTAEYLRGADLRALLRQHVEAVQRSSGLPRTAQFEYLHAPLVATYTGLPGVFRPLVTTYAEHYARWAAGFANPLSPDFMAVPTTQPELWDVLIPAQMFSPTRPPEFFIDIADTFNSTSVGIAFNSFSPEQGVEYLHVNEPAMKLIGQTDPGADYGSRNGRTVYERINAEYVRSGLWLLEYGFTNTVQGQALIDGVYARSIILDELTFADQIYAVRPTNVKWLGRTPRNVFEREDLKTELWFNAAYREQAKAIGLVNALLEGRHGHRLERIADTETGKTYHPVELVPVEIETQRGFFDYFVEEPAVFDRAYAQSLDALWTAA